MRMDRCSKRKLLLLVAAGLAVASSASADDHDKKSGNSRVPSYFAYPRGRSLAQHYAQPSAGIGSLAAFNSSPGSVSPSGSMSVLYQQPATRNLVARECLLLPHSTAQIRLGSAQAGLVGGPQIIHKFGYGLQYKEVPLSRHTSQGLVIASRGNQRKVLFSRDRNLPDPDQLPADTQPTIKQEDATQVGLADTKDAVRGIDFDVAAGGANEAPHLEIVVGEKGKGELAWTYVVRSKDRKDRFARQYWVAAQGAARILLKEDLVYLCGGQQPPTASTPATATAMAIASATKGNVTGNIYAYKKSPRDPADKNKPLQYYVAESVNGTQIVSDSTGQYEPVPGPLNTSLIGPFAHVINDGSGGALVPKQDGNNLLFDAVTESELAQVSAFYWVNFAHDFVKPFLPGTLTKLANNEVHVNINETCNAFWSGADNSLNFFKAGDSTDGSAHCVNSAYCDVVCHEFGHGVDAEFGEILDAAYSEGFGDSLAILITQDSVVGRDFLGQSMNLRNAADPIQWPDVKDDFDPHVAGQPYACFTWDLIAHLKDKFGGDKQKAYDTVKELTLAAAALNPRDVPDAVRLVFFVDHQNGSKFFDEMAKAADAHQIPRPSDRTILNNPANLNLAAQ